MSKLAIALVEKCIATKSDYLDLGRCGLTDKDFAKRRPLYDLLPECKTHLRTLVLSSSWYEYDENGNYHRRESKNTGRPNNLSAHPPTLLELSALTALIIGGHYSSATWEIRDITFVAALPNLQQLYIAYNQIADINPIQKLNQLQILHISYNQIVDITPIQNLNPLQQLDISNNQIADINPTQNLNQLQHLNIANNQIAEINPIQNLNQLQHLNIANNQIAEINPIQNLNQLQKLNISHNQIADITPIQNLNQLQQLYISHNQIADITPIQNLNELQKLYISNNQIADITPIQNLNQLQHLSISSNKISDITPIQNLNQLQELYISNNKIEDITSIQNLNQLQQLDISSNQIADINPIQNLNQLKELHIYNNQIADINGLRNLNQLQQLDISNNQIVDITPIQNLNQLQQLDISNNQIADINPIQNLNQLQQLDIDNNKIADITPIQNLNQLQKLNIFNNQIADINGLRNLNQLKTLWIDGNKIKDLRPLLTLQPFIENTLDFGSDLFEGNPLESPPVKIANQGIKAIKNYFAQIDKEKGKTKYLFEAKLLVIGEGETGKTSFARKLQDPDAELPKDKDKTLGIDIHLWNYKDNLKTGKKQFTKVDFYLNLWDFGGQRIYQGTHQLFFNDSSLYVLVGDTRKQGSNFTYWLNTIEQLGGDNSILLVLLNKKHGHNDSDFDEGYRNRFHKIIKEVITVDLKNDTDGIVEMQETIKAYVRKLEGIGDPLPPSWVKIRSDLQKEKENFISLDRFRTICKKHDIVDHISLKTVSGYFTRIGAITHYFDDRLLRERVYLNSNWLVKTVYEVLDNETAKDKKKAGRLSRADVAAMWTKAMQQKSKKEEVFDIEEEFDRLTELMHKFGLMYHVPAKDLYVIPEHLPATQPYPKWQYAEEPGLLRFNYEFDKYMPQGIMSQVIVGLHDYIVNHNHVWHKGVNVEWEGAYAEITESLGSKNGYEVRIAGTNKRALLAIIRERFAKVFEPFKNLQYRQLVPCVCKECARSAEPHSYEYNKMVEMSKFGKPTVTCDAPPYHEVLIMELLASVDLPMQGRRGLRLGKGDLSFSRVTPSNTISFFAEEKTQRADKKKMFISYAHADEKLWKNKFCKHLSSLEGAGLIEHWHDRYIHPGPWDLQIKAAMESADIFVLLITENFMASDYITSQEITTAYRKWKAGEAEIIPVICDACHWSIKPLGDGATLGDLQAYPTDAKAIKNWRNQSNAFLNIMQQLEKLIRGAKTVNVI